MTDNMQRARELLAEQYEQDSRSFTARTILSNPERLGEDVDRALRAIAAALRQAAAVPEAKYPDDGNGDDDAYNRGWNDCRKAMLAAAPTVSAEGECNAHG